MGIHLDLGCGSVPRNPYHQEQVVGVDIREESSLSISIQSVNYHQCNFVIEPLPFPDNHFDSLSAYDVIEHIPRQLHVTDRGLIYPFINLMNEIHRVLKPGGLFLATIPAYPSSEAFQDPTHVNIITKNTAQYFSGFNAPAAMYGFHGNFTIILNKFCIRNNYLIRNSGFWRNFTRRWHRKLFKGGWPHIIWKLKTVK